jgi:hypothetical protein
MSEVKETKEAIIGALKLGAYLVSKFKDGVQVADFSDIMAKFQGDAEFKAVIEAAYSDAEKIPAELKATDFKGGLELMVAILGELPAIQDQLGQKAG